MKGLLMKFPITPSVVKLTESECTMCKCGQINQPTQRHINGRYVQELNWIELICCVEPASIGFRCVFPWRWNLLVPGWWVFTLPLGWETSRGLCSFVHACDHSEFCSRNNETPHLIQFTGSKNPSLDHRDLTKVFFTMMSLLHNSVCVCVCVSHMLALNFLCLCCRRLLVQLRGLVATVLLHNQCYILRHWHTKAVSKLFSQTKSKKFRPL